MPLEPPADAPLAGEVDPFVGTSNDGQTFPGAVLPWGMASPSPHTTRRSPIELLDHGPANAGYLSGEPTIHGFGQTHLSGVGCPDLGAPVITPTVGAIDTSVRGLESGYENERAHAGYYAVHLVDPDVNVELTATPRVGVHRFGFPTRDGDANVLIDVGRSLSWQGPDGDVRVVSPTEAEGSVALGLFCAQATQPRLFFVARFDRPARATGTWTRAGATGAPAARGEAGAFFRFDARTGEPLVLAVGLSWTSIDGARANLDAEAASLDFDALHGTAARAWQTELSRVGLEGDRAMRRRTLTALYHALLHPNVASDASGDFVRAAGGTESDPGHDRFTVFSLWDTYRTLHPLLSLIWPERQQAMVRTLAALTEELGVPPQWELLSDPVDVMVGDPADIVIADSVAKGLIDDDVDLEALYGRLFAAAHDPDHRAGVESYDSLGYIPMEERRDVWGPVSTTLEYALADASLAELAERLGHVEDAAALRTRAVGYRALYHEDSGLLRPKNRDGTWHEPFDPDATRGSGGVGRSGGPGYVEGSAWIYQFFAPHDVEGLVTLHGGEEELAARLSDFFDRDLFDMSNEPDIGYPYLFLALGGQAHHAHREVAIARDRFFGDGPGGLPGNDDTGTISAWLVWSAIGLYPDLPRARYAIGTPAFDRVTIALSGGRTLVIEAPDRERPYVTSMEWNEAPLTTPYLDHDELAAGGTLVLRTRATP